LITGLSIWSGLRKKYVLVGWLWYVGTLVPVIGLVQSGDQAIADRYMYIPMLGLLIILVFTIKEFFTKGLYTRVFTTVLALAVLFSAIVSTR
jgi:hypothetical protein